MKSLLKKIVPKQLILGYHFTLAKIGALLYGFPSRKMYTIGVTGTNGKTTVSNLIVDILQESGKTAGCATTTNFRVGTIKKQEDKLNDTKQTMLGRMKLQKFLRHMVKSGATYAVIETSSEGIVQFRHAGIDYRAAVFTNLTPEHIESHGSIENYRQAKEKLFQKVSREHPKDGVGVYNLDSEHVDHFLKYPIAKKYGFTFDRHTQKTNTQVLRALDVELHADGSRTSLLFKGKTYEMNLKLRGIVNVENALAAICVGISQGISISTALRALERHSFVPGRFEFISESQDFDVLVDYAPEPASMKQLFEFIDLYKRERSTKKVIHVTGSAGGGRDKSRRPILGKMSADNSDITIVTNEDPYDEDPQTIIDQVAQGALDAGKKLNESVFKVPDRRDAIKLAFEKASANDLVVLTGKGSEQAIVIKNNKKVPWDERTVARELLKNLGKTQPGNW